MLIDHKNKFIFIHIPKTAGTSISYTLGGIHPKDITSFKNPIAILNNDPHKTITEGHRLAVEVRDMVDRDTWDSYFKFAFVRNPWDRAVSIYCHIQGIVKGGAWLLRNFDDFGFSFREVAQAIENAPPDIQDIKSRAFVLSFGNEFCHNSPMAAPILNRLKKAVVDSIEEQKNLFFSEWLKEYTFKIPEGDIANRLLHIPQLKWLTDKNGEIIVDFIGRFENLKEDFAFVADKVGLDKNIVHTGERRKKDPYGVYYDQESMELIREWCRDDIDCFGYKFDDPKKMLI